MNEPEADTDLLEILTDAARMGDVCPSTVTLARTLGITNTAVQLGFDRLRCAGKIAWRVAWCGDVHGKVRVVTLSDTGEQTRTPISARVPPLFDAALADAKMRLRRKGHVVFDAEITDGARGRDLVRVDHERLSRRTVLRRAGVVS